MIITVTSEHIKAGIPAKPRQCPIALAIGPLLKDCYPIVIPTQVWIVKDVIVARLPLPPIAEDNARRFDAGLAILPFSFELDVEERYLAPGPYQWIEATVQLHEELRIWYVVTGWRIEFFEGDNDEVVVLSTEAGTIAEALNLMDKKLSEARYGARKGHLGR